MKTKLFFLSALLCTGILTSCTPEDNAPIDQDPTPPTPVLNAGDGALIAIRNNTTTTTPIGEVEVNIGLGVAFLWEGTNYSTFVDGGAISLNSESLEKQSNNAYTFKPSATNYTGIDFSGGVNWSVGGNGGVPMFTHTTSIGFPGIEPITSAETVVMASGYTLTTTEVTGADSVIFQVGDVTKTMPAGTISCNFSASDLSSLSAGTSLVMIAAYRMEQGAYSGKNYYFINETVVNKSVTIE